MIVLCSKSKITISLLTYQFFLSVELRRCSPGVDLPQHAALGEAGQVRGEQAVVGVREHNTACRPSIKHNTVGLVLNTIL